MRSRIVRAVIALLAMFVFVGGIATPAPSVHAGSNGQQVGASITCGTYAYGPYLREVRFVGKNHNGESTYWRSSHSGNTRSIFTWGWWLK